MNYRSLDRAVLPSVEPITLYELKRHLRLEHDEDNLYLAAAMTAAREFAESYTNRTFCNTQWTMRLDTFPHAIELPRPPVSRTVTATTITYTTETQSAVTLPSNKYRIDRISTPGVIRTLYGETWPPHLADYNSIAVTWWAGYSEDGSKVPMRARNAMLMLAAHWFERRLPVDTLSAVEVPFGVKSLLDSVKWGAYQ